MEQLSLSNDSTKFLQLQGRINTLNILSVPQRLQVLNRMVATAREELSQLKVQRNVGRTSACPTCEETKTKSKAQVEALQFKVEDLETHVSRLNEGHDHLFTTRRDAIEQVQKKEKQLLEKTAENTNLSLQLEQAEQHTKEEQRTLLKKIVELSDKGSKDRKELSTKIKELENKLEENAEQMTNVQDIQVLKNNFENEREILSIQVHSKRSQLATAVAETQKLKTQILNLEKQLEKETSHSQIQSVTIGMLKQELERHNTK